MWRKLEVGGGFNMFDKVICLKHSKEDIGIIISNTDSDLDIKIMRKNGSTFYAKIETIKPYYGEFQKEFEALDESKKKMEEVEELSNKLAKAREEAESLYQKGKKIVELNISKQFIL